MSLFVDLGSLSHRCCDDALEHIYKAISEPSDDGIWAPHENPFIQRLVELFTARGIARMDRVEAELRKWMAGDMHHAGKRPKRPGDQMQRWSPAELALVKVYLETLPPAEFTLNDWTMVVEYLVQRYLPLAEMVSEAEWMAVRATMLGRVAANMSGITLNQADRVLAALPLKSGEVERVFHVAAPLKASLEHATTRAVENVTSVQAWGKHRLKAAVIEHRAAVARGEPAGNLESKLFDTFGDWNRDWRRVAVTEAGEATNQGMVASVPPGTKLKRVEQYATACAFCKGIHGQVFTVRAADDPDKDGDTEIWPGKNNIGRSASPRRRQGGKLVDREGHEVWWTPAGVMHPHCRGRWVNVEPDPGADKEFGAWLRSTLSAA